MLTKIISVLSESVQRFGSNNGFANAAATAYYAAFSLPSLLLISIALVGFFVEPQNIHGEIVRNIESMAGEDAAQQIEQIVAAADKPKQSFFATVAGGAMLLFGSTGVLFQLQTALNQVWKVEAKPSENTWLAFFLKRILSLSMLLVIAFLLLVTISVRAVLSEIGPQLETILPTSLSTGMLIIINQIAGFILLCVLLASMFRFLPDAKIPWRSVWFGALVTSLLFTAGKQVMGIYLSYSNPGEIYGAAGSLAIILIWVYYASLLVLFGAQLTQTWNELEGTDVLPDEFAVEDGKS